MVAIEGHGLFPVHSSRLLRTGTAEGPRARRTTEQAKRTDQKAGGSCRAVRASVPIPKFAGICRTLGCELRNQRDTTSIMLLVSRFGSSLHFAARSRANFRIKATLASI